jgi:hypothetical protein
MAGTAAACKEISLQSQRVVGYTHALNFLTID